MKNIFVFGSLNMDLVISSPYMPKAGETIVGSGFMINPGGKGANQAITSAKLGYNTYMIGSVGNDLYGKDLINNLSVYGVNTEYIEIKDGVSTGIAVILLNENDNRIILDLGANYQVNKTLIKHCLDNISKKEDIYVTQLELEHDTVLYGLKEAKKKGLYTIFNPAPVSQLNNDFFLYSDLIILNETEAEYITEMNLNKENIERVFSVLKDKGAKDIILTLGSKGSVTMINNKVEYVSAFKVEAVDTTAAGDSYVGAIAGKLATNAKLFEAMKFATKVSAMTVTKVGAQCSIPNIKEFNEHYNI